MRIDAPIFTGSFSLNGNTLQNLSAVSTTGSNTFIGNQSIIGAISASALTGSIDFTNLTNSPTLISGSSQVVNILSSLNTATASFTPRISNLESKSSSVDISISNINSITASNIARLNNLETKSASVDISVSSINTFTSSNGNTSLNSKTGSYATTGSNTFFGTQTFSGSVYIANDLVVQGSSSIQYISASSVSIGTNIVQLNTANPSVRFAGLTMIDSGSIGGSGSFLYDSVQDEFIFVHRGNGTNVTSSHFVLGPETYDNLGNELYLTCNVLTKGTGKEHLVDSCIFDNGTTTCIKNNLVGTGTACFNGQVCATSFMGGSSTFTASQIDLTLNATSISNFSRLVFQDNGTEKGVVQYINSGFTTTSRRCKLELSSAGGINFITQGNFAAPDLSISSTGVTTFSSQICSAGIRTTDSVVLLKNAATDNRYIQFCDTNTGGYRYDFILQGTANGCGFGLYNNTTSAWSSYVTPNGNTGLGGTTSPGGRLEVWQCTNNRLVIDCANVQNEPRISSLDSAGNPQYLTINSYDLKIKSNGSEALRITDKKHLLVGTQTDLSFYSNWDSGVTRIGTSGVLFSYLNNVDNFIISQNYYVNAAGSDVRIASGAASNIYFASGDILFRTAGTGVAESATSWNTPLRLTCTGASLISGCATFYCTAQFSKIQKHPTGYWYKIPFSVSKNTNVGTAGTFCIVNITSQDSFNEMFIYVEYASRLQGQSDTQTQVSSRMYGINRFNSGTIAVTNSYTLVGGSGCVIDTHAPITAVAVGNCTIVVKVDFSTSTSYSSFVWGEIRVYSIENLNNSLTIPYNEW